IFRKKCGPHAVYRGCAALGTAYSEPPPRPAMSQNHELCNTLQNTRRRIGIRLSIEYMTGHHGARWLLPSHEFCKHPPTDYLGRDWGRNWGIFINFAV
ncbi:MAG: hypothetical protein K2K59_03920, partial [Muribaculaceae bacterium]|nr:hypothetical protein [Muribaculaceae bacterium]